MINTYNTSTEALKHSVRFSSLPLGVSLICLVILGSSGCTARTPGHLAAVSVEADSKGSGSTNTSTASPDESAGGPGMPPAVNQYGERFDTNAEQAIADRSLHAWRVAIKHAKKPADQNDSAYKKQRISDEKQGMDELGKLAKEYPDSSTVKFMQGQVEEHFGKNQEAYEFFKAAGAKNRMNSVVMFKMAESERKGGHHARAVEEYRKLLEHVKDSGITTDPAKIGLSRSLLEIDPASMEARKLIADVLASDPENKDAQQVAAGFQSTKAGKSDKKNK